MTGDSRTSATSAVTIAVIVVTPLSCGLAVLGGIGSFATIRHLAAPWFGSSAWMVPVGVDLGIVALLAWDLLAEYLRVPWPPARWSAWAFIAATVYLNIAAARGNLNASVMHAAMPALFITVIEGIRHLIRQRTGLADGTRTEPIPLARWLLAPRSSFLTFRHMAFWHITSYRQALNLEHQRLQAIARLQQEHGHYLWRFRAPLTERLALRPTPVSNATGMSAETLPIGESTSPRRTRLSRIDAQLIGAAEEIVREARRDGTRLSQAALASKLRARGHTVANARLHWLMTTTTGTSQANEIPGPTRG